MNLTILLNYQFALFTARVRSTREGYVLTRASVSVHICGGGGEYPIPGPGRWGRYPIQLIEGGGTPSQVWMGYPPLDEHLLRGGQYASCVHAGGLSCSSVFIPLPTQVMLFEEVIFQTGPPFRRNT